MIRPRRRVRRSPRGGYELRIPDAERALLKRLPNQLAELLRAVQDSSGPLPDQLRRLLPPAYLGDEEAEASYVRLLRAELIEHHQNALALLSTTADAEHLDDEQADGWLYAINDLRLALGSAIGVTEEATELEAGQPGYGDWVCYQYLSFLQGEIVDALAAGLPPDPTGADDSLPEDPWGEPPGGLRWDGTPRPGLA